MRTHFPSSCLLLAALACVTNCAQAPVVRANTPTQGPVTNTSTRMQLDKAPPSLDKIADFLQLDGKPRPTWSSLKGKVVVLEFWFTTCLPCREAMPHLNKLADKYRDRGVEFISVTFEPSSAVEPFLKTTAMHSIIGCDSNKGLIAEAGVESYPTTVVVGKDGLIKAITSPEYLKDEVLDNALAGKPLALEDIRSSREIPQPEDSQGDDVFYARLTPAPTDLQGPMMRIGPQMFYMRAADLPMLVRMAFGRGLGKRMHIDLKPNTTLYRVDIKVPKDSGKTANDVLQQMLKDSFNIQVRTEDVEEDALVCTIEGKPKGLSVPKEIGKIARKGSHFMGWRVKDLVDAAASAKGMQGVDETGISGTFDFDLDLDSPKPIEEQLYERFNIRARVEKRKLPHVYVTQK